MKWCFRFLLFCICLTPMFANAGFYSDPDWACWTDDDGCDEFWYCGKQGKSCAGDSPWGCDDPYWLYHGQTFTKHGRTFWCCNGSGTQKGTFKEGSTWIAESKFVTETLPEGKCTWLQKINICGQVDNPGDKCTEATGQCSQGYVSHNGKCITACADGQAFESATSNNCISCEASPTQGIKNGNCIKCPANQFFNINTQSCVDRSTYVHVSDSAYNQCWMCSTPGAMYSCMKLISNGNDLASNTKLQAACSVNSKKADASEFKLPEYQTVKVQLSSFFGKLFGLTTEKVVRPDNGIN